MQVIVTIGQLIVTVCSASLREIFLGLAQAVICHSFEPIVLPLISLHNIPWAIYSCTIFSCISGHSSTAQHFRAQYFRASAARYCPAFHCITCTSFCCATIMWPSYLCMLCTLGCFAPSRAWRTQMSGPHDCPAFYSPVLPCIPLHHLHDIALHNRVSDPLKWVWDSHFKCAIISIKWFESRICT